MANLGHEIVDVGQNGDGVSLYNHAQGYWWSFWSGDFLGEPVGLLDSFKRVHDASAYDKAADEVQRRIFRGLNQLTKLPCECAWMTYVPEPP
jgi:hypothetical protein